MRKGYLPDHRTQEPFNEIDTIIFGPDFGLCRFFTKTDLGAP